MTEIKYKSSEWRKMETIKEATKTTGKLRRDSEGRVVEFIHGGKYVTAKAVAWANLPEDAFFKGEITPNK